MSATLYPYYERELAFFRQLAEEFARRYPATAVRLGVEPGGNADPHVERLIEAFSLIAGRIQHKLDDEFPELIEALLEVLYPHYLAPVPSMAIVQFDLDPELADLPNGFQIDRHSRLHTQPVEYRPGKKLSCRFRTGYPVTLWPIQVAAARLQPPPFPTGLQLPSGTAAVLCLRLECLGDLTFAGLTLDKLRFFLCGDNQLIPSLYELLFNHTLQVMFRPLDGAAPRTPLVCTPRQCLFPVGFERDEGLLPYPARSFSGYQLLTEFFAFPQKFWFLDLGGFRQAARAGFAKAVEVIFCLNRTLPSLEQVVTASTFRLGGTPVVNLFEQEAEPIRLNQARYEYRVFPLDRAHSLGHELYSIQAVTGTDPATATTTTYQPFYSFRHGLDREGSPAFWYASRRPAVGEGDPGTEVHLHLVDQNYSARLPAEEVLGVRATWTNRDVPRLLQQAGEALYLELEAAAPLARVRCLRAPTHTLRPPLRRGRYWRLLSHLTLNHLSLTDPVEGREALQEILRLYDFSDPDVEPQLAAVTQQVIEGITSLSSCRVVGRTGGPPLGGHCKGLEVTIEFDEQKYIGTGTYLFASVLERFLGQYASINSFTQLVAKTRQAGGDFKRWPPRAADLQLL